MFRLIGSLARSASMGTSSLAMRATTLLAWLSGLALGPLGRAGQLQNDAEARLTQTLRERGYRPLSDLEAGDGIATDDYPPRLVLIQGGLAEERIAVALPAVSVGSVAGAKARDMARGIGCDGIIGGLGKAS